MDWNLFKTVYEAKRRRPLLDEIGDRRTAKPAPAGDSTLLNQLVEAPPSERKQILARHIRIEASEVMGVNPLEIDADLGLFQMGMDSLMAVQFKNASKTAWGGVYRRL